MNPRLLSACFFAVIITVSAGAPAPFTATEGIIPGQYAIVLKEDIDLKDFELHMEWVSGLLFKDNERRASKNKKMGRPITNDTYRITHYLGASYGGKFSDQTIRIINTSPQVESVTPSFKVTPWANVFREAGSQPSVKERKSGLIGVPKAGSKSARSLKSVYHGFKTLTQTDAPWGLAAISQQDMIPSNLEYTHEYLYEPPTGKSTYAYVLDTGIKLDHVEFQGRAIKGFDATNGTYEPSSQAHGTHVAGIIGGARYGVAKNTTLIDVQVMTDNAGSTLDLARGLKWAVDDIMVKGRLGTSVINISLGFDASDAAVKRQMDAAEKVGIPLVIAAGNLDNNARDISPANYKTAITVAAMTKNYTRWEDSNWGARVDIYAPGHNIPSAGIRNNTEIAIYSGTSTAAPHVAGVIVYLIDQYGPDLAERIWNRVKWASSSSLIKDVKGGPNRLLFNANRKEALGRLQSL